MTTDKTKLIEEFIGSRCDARFGGSVAADAKQIALEAVLYAQSLKRADTEIVKPVYDWIETQIADPALNALGWRETARQVARGVLLRIITDDAMMRDLLALKDDAVIAVPPGSVETAI